MSENAAVTPKSGIDPGTPERLKGPPPKRSLSAKASAGDKPRRGIRIPILFKLSVFTALLIWAVSTTISFTLLKRQKQQFIDQLVDLGKSVSRIVVNNSPDKLLGEEDLALYELVKDIAENDQVIFAAITDNKDVVRAHSNFEKTGEIYIAPEKLTPFSEDPPLLISTFGHNNAKALYFETPIRYMDLDIGRIYLGISQEKILRNIHDAEMSILQLTGIIVLIGLLMALLVSFYFSKPITQLLKGTRILATGNFVHRVKIRRHDELGDLATAFNQMAEGLSEREMIRNVFGKYVSPQIRDEILSGKIPLDGERREATLLFADLRGFTPYVEKNSPEEVIQSMREYFTAMQGVIGDNEGLVLQYIGDEIEAVFGVPVHSDDCPDRAVRAALGMKNALDELNRQRAQRGVDPFAHGVGIYTGQVLAGNIGSQDRLSYTLIGNTVNLASRIQGLTKVLACDILVSEETVKKLKHTYTLLPKEPARVKGYSKPIMVYELKT